MPEKKNEVLQNVLTNIGVLLVLVGSIAVKGENLPFFFIGMVLLALQTLELRIEPRRRALAEIILSAAVVIASVTQLVMSKAFNAPQVFLVLVMLGGILVIVESLRRYTDQ